MHQLVRSQAADKPYRGRFAPSPSGPLHFGSLVCAVASFLDAKSHHGRWLVRIDDIDPPREQVGAADNILTSLERHQLLWDDNVLYQSSRADAYRHALNELTGAGYVYRCDCTRKRLKIRSAHDTLTHYDNYCRQRRLAPDQPAALRLNLHRIPDTEDGIRFYDGIQGEQSCDIRAHGDFCIHRKDGLFAYQLAVVVDDIFQDISHVVRGADLLDVTAQQIAVFSTLGANHPAYYHHPVVTNPDGKKLSKQNNAPALDATSPTLNLYHACCFLGMGPDRALTTSAPQDIIDWALAHWDINDIPRVAEQQPTF